MPWAAPRSPQGDPAGEAAASERHDDQAHLRRGAGDLEADRPLAGDDGRLVERVHERQPLLLGEPGGGRPRLVVAAVDELDLATVLADGGDLGDRRLLRHDEHRAGAGIASRKATAWAWLPALGATTPAASASSERRRIMFVAPRALNEPVS